MRAPGPPAPPPKKRGCLFVVLALLGGGLALCCCLGGLLVAAGEGVVGPEVALGTALVPAELSADEARAYHFRGDSAAYGLGYGLGDAERRAVNARFENLATEFTYEPGVGNDFRWTVPAQCKPQAWRCIYDELATANAAEVAPLTELFRRHQREANLDVRALTQLVVSFVQTITWRLPDTAFGILPPALVVADGWGDCDSKSLLAAIMLEQLGVDAVVLYSQTLEHAALGVALPGTGQRFSHDGTKYLYVESTYPGWALGTVPPKYDRPTQWEVVPFTLHE